MVLIRRASEPEVFDVIMAHAGHTFDPLGLHNKVSDNFIWMTDFRTQWKVGGHPVNCINSIVIGVD